jgi:hypothetical protein
MQPNFVSKSETTALARPEKLFKKLTNISASPASHHSPDEVVRAEKRNSERFETTNSENSCANSVNGSRLVPPEGGSAGVAISWSRYRSTFRKKGSTFD